MTVPENCAEFVAKWRAREPEMAWIEVFCARDARARFALWGALLSELRAAAFELSDTRVTEAKSTWWAEELLHGAQGSPRHPLTQALAMPPATCNALAQGMIATTHAEPSRPSDVEAALVSVTPFAAGIAAAEAALFGSASGDDAMRAVAVHLLAERLRMRDGAFVPLSLLARHGINAAALDAPQAAAAWSDWAAQLAAALPSSLGDAALYRRGRTAFDAWLLRERVAHRDLHGVPPLRALRLAWRAARSVANG